MLRSACLTILFLPALVRAETPSLHFEKDVRPILKQLCFHCHGEWDAPKGKLDLRLVRLMTTGGSSGPAIVPGKADESILWQRVEADEMPEGGKKLSDAQKLTLKAWINQGAKTRRPEPNDPALARFTEEELGHWAFQPVKRPTPTMMTGNIRTPIDAFIAAGLQSRGLSMSPEADRRTLIRRATFDLWGMPPTPEQVEAFVQDSAPDAYERLIDRLLESPHYGERWGRHWLDVAGYAESNGNIGLDPIRPYAWRYRDYVIDSFNRDKPYNVFVQEQLAGDEMVRTPIDSSDPTVVDHLSGVSFLRMAPDATQSTFELADRNQAVAEMLKVVSSSMLGMTVGCAQCHDHKYDPIAQEDYYRLRGLFDPAFALDSWQRPSVRVIDVTSPVMQNQIDCLEAAATFEDQEIHRELMELSSSIFEKALLSVPDNEREALRAASLLPDPKRTPEQKTLVSMYPKVRAPSVVATFLQDYDPVAERAFDARRVAVKKFRETKPEPHRLMSVSNMRPTAQTKLFNRGDPDQPKQLVTPGELTVLEQQQKWAAPTASRRLAYAQHLTDGTHPLTARVMVNRLWHHHFGRGIVATTGDFGINGDRPTHPELLDWLADEFAANGWRIKAMHRLMMTSAVYRQQSQRTTEGDRIDINNHYLSRMNLRRLEAESVRDTMLAVTGTLNPELGGPSVPVTEDYDGRGILGKRELNVFGKPYGNLELVSASENHRRSVYVQSQRALPLTMLETFDLPVMTPNCEVRRSSTVTPQSLLLLNDQEVVQHSGVLADRLYAQARDSASRVRLAYELLYSTEPTEAELNACLSFLAKQQDYFTTYADPAWQANVKKYPHAPELRAMAGLCQTLLSANRFFYID